MKMQALFSSLVAAAFCLTLAPLPAAADANPSPSAEASHGDLSKAERKKLAAEKKAAKRKAARAKAVFKWFRSEKAALAFGKKYNLPVWMVYSDPATCPVCVVFEKEILNNPKLKRSRGIGCGYISGSSIVITRQPRDVKCKTSIYDDYNEEPENGLLFYENNPVTFSVSAKSLKGDELTYQWYRKDNENPTAAPYKLTEDGYYKGVTTSTLKMPVSTQACLEDYSYFCVIGRKGDASDTLKTAEAKLTATHAYSYQQAGEIVYTDDGAKKRRNTRSLGSIRMGLPITVSWAAFAKARATSSRACLKQALTKRII